MEFEKAKNPQLTGCFCLVDIKLPSVKLETIDHKLYSGIAEEFTLCLESGSIPIEEGSILRARFPDAADNIVEFLVSFKFYIQLIAFPLE
jgi:hypothetical protein